MDNIKIDPVKEIERLEAMYKNYKILYRKLMFCCISNEKKKTVKSKRDEYKQKRDEYKQKIQRVIDLRWSLQPH